MDRIRGCDCWRNNFGNNVLIAPLSYVNIDVPDNSLVIGNPAKIIPKEDATDGYINFTIV